jgi:O-antigen/teichoic acid export membrane protein
LSLSRLSLKKNIAWNSSGSFIYLFFQWLINYLVVVILGFKDAGIFSLAISISIIAFAFATYGVRGYQVSDVTKKYSDKSYVAARIITSLLATIGCVAYLVLYKYDIYTTLCVIVYLLFRMSEAYVDVYHGIIQRAMRMDFIGKSFILRGVIGNLLFIGCMLLTKNLLLSISVLAISSFVLIFIYDRNKVKLFYEKTNTTSLKIIIGLLIECLPLAIYVLLSNLLMSIPRISLEHINGTEILGIYASIAIPAAIIQVISGYIFAPLLTVFAEHVSQKNFKLFHKLLFRTLAYILLISGILILGGAVFGDFGLKLLFGEKISGYTYLFLPILFISSLTALSWFIGLMLTVLREFKGLIISSVVAVMVCIFGSSVAINLFDINGTSFILILALSIQIGIMSVYMQKRIKIIQPNG